VTQGYLEAVHDGKRRLRKGSRNDGNSTLPGSIRRLQSTYQGRTSTPSLREHGSSWHWEERSPSNMAKPAFTTGSASSSGSQDAAAGLPDVIVLNLLGPRDSLGHYDQRRDSKAEQIKLQLCSYNRYMAGFRLLSRSLFVASNWLSVSYPPAEDAPPQPVARTAILRQSIQDDIRHIMLTNGCLLSQKAQPLFCCQLRRSVQRRLPVPPANGFFFYKTFDNTKCPLP